MSQWEALALLLIGISINQMRSLPAGTSALGLPVATGAYIYTCIFVSDFPLISSSVDVFICIMHKPFDTLFSN